MQPHLRGLRRPVFDGKVLGRCRQQLVLAHDGRRLKRAGGVHVGSDNRHTCARECQSEAIVG